MVHVPGLIGLAISYALSMTSTLGGVMSAFTETEREMIAVERVAEYIHTVSISSTSLIRLSLQSAMLCSIMGHIAHALLDQHLKCYIALTH